MTPLPILLSLGSLTGFSLLAFLGWWFWRRLTNPFLSGDERLTTTLPPDDDRRNKYTCYGRKLLEKSNPPVYYYDGCRTRPTLVIGRTGSGKTEFLINLCVSDMSKGRFTAFVDGKCDISVFEKLRYYAAKCGRPFYSLFPFTGGDLQTHCWNPLMSTLPKQYIAEAIFNAFKKPSKTEGDAAVYKKYQLEVFRDILTVFAACKHEVCLNDVAYILENPSALDHVMPYITGPEGVGAYQRLLKRMNDQKANFAFYTLDFLNFLRLCDHWSLNSYNPQIQLDAMIYTDAVLYVGLPVNAMPEYTKALGNILINNLKMLSQLIQQRQRYKRRAISVNVDEAGAFCDAAMADWICKVRSAGFLLSLGIQLIDNLAGVRAGFENEILANVPNVVLFNPRDQKTAEWFSKASGTETRKVMSANVATDNLENPSEVGGTARMTGTPRISTSEIMQLRTGQAYFMPESVIHTPIKLAAPFLPDVPDLPRKDFRRLRPARKPERPGLNLSSYRLIKDTQVHEDVAAVSKR